MKGNYKCRRCRHDDIGQLRRSGIRQMLGLLFKTGMRRGELLSLDLGDVNLVEKYHTIEANSEKKQSDAVHG